MIFVPQQEVELVFESPPEEVAKETGEKEAAKEAGEKAVSAEKEEEHKGEVLKKKRNWIN